MTKQCDGGQITIKLGASDAAALDRLTARTPLRRCALARELMRLGAALVEADPAALFRANKESS